MTHEKILIRTATLHDLEEVYRMICGLEETMLDRNAFDGVFRQNLSSENIGYFIAESNSRPVGMAGCHIQPLLHHAALIAEIQEMFVDSAFRSQQIGKMLMNHMVVFAKSRGAVQLEVTSRNRREKAHQFYQREGFEKSHVKLVRYFDTEK
jgi:PhnO protein